MNRAQLFRLLRWVYEHFTHVRIENESVLPEEGGFIIATNHMSRIDFPPLLYTKRYNDMYALVADKYKSYPLIAYLCNHVGMIWIDRSRADFTAFKQVFRILKEGKILALSPEGTRSRTGQLIEAKTGVSLIASKSGMPIVPLSITGTEHFIDDFRHLRKPTITLRFSPPYYPERIDTSDRDASLHQITNDLMCRIASMLPASYRGFYRDFPQVQTYIEEWKKHPELKTPSE